jgi:hypothetical protein
VKGATVKGAEVKPLPFLRATLRRPNLAEEVDDQAKQADELAGDLATKTEHLFEGLDWWLRGRYGRGPEVWGLAKSGAALKNRSLLIALEMPSEPPVPTPPADPRRAPVPQFDRRHHYTWAWEDRRLQKDLSGSRMQTGASRKHTVTKFHH